MSFVLAMIGFGIAISVANLRNQHLRGGSGGGDSQNALQLNGETLQLNGEDLTLGS